MSSRPMVPFATVTCLDRNGCIQPQGPRAFQELVAFSPLCAENSVQPNCRCSPDSLFKAGMAEVGFNHQSNIQKRNTNLSASPRPCGHTLPPVQLWSRQSLSHPTAAPSLSAVKGRRLLPGQVRLGVPQVCSFPPARGSSPVPGPRQLSRRNAYSILPRTLLVAGQPIQASYALAGSCWRSPTSLCVSFWGVFVQKSSFSCEAGGYGAENSPCAKTCLSLVRGARARV